MRPNKWTFVVTLIGLMVTACLGIATAPATLTPTLSPSTATWTPQAPVSTIAPPSPTSSPAIPPTITPTPSGAWTQLTPDHGVPGTTVRIDGFLPGGFNPTDLKNNDYKTHANICWDGCLNGLVIEGAEVSWSSTEAGRFTSQFTIPAAPYLKVDGPHPLKPGDYSVGLQCLGPDITGCALLEAQINAIFHLGGSPVTCPDGPCGTISLSPAKAAPGTQIKVQGWAPLKQIIGDTPFGLSLVLEPQGGSQGGSPASTDLLNLATVDQKLDGSFTAAFQVPQRGTDFLPLAPGTYTLALDAGSFVADKQQVSQQILLAPTPFEIMAAPAWTHLQRPRPFWIGPSASPLNNTMAVDPLDPRHLAYCAPGAIRLSQDGGQSWTSISTASAAKLAESSAYPMFSQDNPGSPTCSAVTLDASHPDSFYAVFTAANKQYGAPPIYYQGYATHDRGKSWALVQAPAGVSSSSQSIEGFGWFWTDGKTVQALFWVPAAPDPAVKVRQTTDGGITWSDASLICPSSGPCIRWGAGPSEISGMGAGLPQAVMASPDSGKTWQSTGQSVELRANGPHELAALSQNEAVLISNSADYPLRYTSDDGKTWQALSLPSLPEANGASFVGFPALQMLPDGSLLALNDQAGTWWALSPNANQWCQLDVPSIGKDPVLLQIAGDQIWWIAMSNQKPHSLPLSKFSCQP